MRLLCAVAAALGGALLAGSASKGEAATFVRVASGLSAPVDVRTAPGDPSTLYVVEQTGRVRTVRGGRVAGTFLDLTSKVKSGGEQGLLALAFDPGYRANRRVYVSYTDRNGDSRVVRYVRRAPSKQLLFVHQPYANHNGGDLQFDAKGFLYLGLGDGGSGGDPQENAQSLGTRLGKLLRWREGAGWQTVGLGLRNPWRFSFDPHGNLWIADVGQDHVEEIDFRRASAVGRLANYGWSRYEGRSVFDAAHRLSARGQLVGPTWTYTHDEGCSVSGGAVYRGRYWFGDFCSGTIWSFRVGAGGRLSPAVRVAHVDSPSAIRVASDGKLYVTSLAGSLYRLGR
ncbi:MAG TPA: PQQ-dependent sugar dehydrogenase [Gaiellaceae bacterium]|nr:PQQ-dependent sugar dehydrogenase [Gaiellaceae bacterium]